MLMAIAKLLTPSGRQRFPAAEPGLEIQRGQYQPQLSQDAKLLMTKHCLTSCKIYSKHLFPNQNRNLFSKAPARQASTFTQAALYFHQPVSTWTLVCGFGTVETQWTLWSLNFTNVFITPQRGPLDTADPSSRYVCDNTINVYNL